MCRVIVQGQAMQDVDKLRRSKRTHFLAPNCVTVMRATRIKVQNENRAASFFVICTWLQIQERSSVGVSILITYTIGDCASLYLVK